MKMHKKIGISLLLVCYVSHICAMDFSWSSFNPVAKIQQVYAKYTQTSYMKLAAGASTLAATVISGGSVIPVSVLAGFLWCDQSVKRHMEQMKKDILDSTKEIVHTEGENIRGELKIVGQHLTTLINEKHDLTYGEVKEIHAICMATNATLEAIQKETKALKEDIHIDGDETRKIIDERHKNTLNKISEFQASMELFQKSMGLFCEGDKDRFTDLLNGFENFDTTIKTQYEGIQAQYNSMSASLNAMAEEQKKDREKSKKRHGKMKKTVNAGFTKTTEEYNELYNGFVNLTGEYEKLIQGQQQATAVVNKVLNKHGKLSKKVNHLGKTVENLAKKINKIDDEVVNIHDDLNTLTQKTDKGFAAVEANGNAIIGILTGEYPSQDSPSTVYVQKATIPSVDSINEQILANTEHIKKTGDEALKLQLITYNQAKNTPKTYEEIEYYGNPSMEVYLDPSTLNKVFNTWKQNTLSAREKEFKYHMSMTTPKEQGQLATRKSSGEKESTFENIMTPIQISVMPLRQFSEKNKSILFNILPKYPQYDTTGESTLLAIASNSYRQQLR
jgi:methyl-accepting chemotaxis protein